MPNGKKLPQKKIVDCQTLQIPLLHILDIQMESSSHSFIGIHALIIIYLISILYSLTYFSISPLLFHIWILVTLAWLKFFHLKCWFVDLICLRKWVHCNCNFIFPCWTSIPICCLICTPYKPKRSSVLSLELHVIFIFAMASNWISITLIYCFRDTFTIRTQLMSFRILFNLEA